MRTRAPDVDAFESFHGYLALRSRHDDAWREDMLALRGKRLGCRCKPGPFRADVRVSWMDVRAKR